MTRTPVLKLSTAVSILIKVCENFWGILPIDSLVSRNKVLCWSVDGSTAMVILGVRAAVSPEAAPAKLVAIWEGVWFSEEMLNANFSVNSSSSILSASVILPVFVFTNRKVLVGMPDVLETCSLIIEYVSLLVPAAVFACASVGVALNVSIRTTLLTPLRSALVDMSPGLKNVNLLVGIPSTLDTSSLAII